MFAFVNRTSTISFCTLYFSLIDFFTYINLYFGFVSVLFFRRKNLPTAETTATDHHTNVWRRVGKSTAAAVAPTRQRAPGLGQGIEWRGKQIWSEGMTTRKMKIVDFGKINKIYSSEIIRDLLRKHSFLHGCKRRSAQPAFTWRARKPQQAKTHPAIRWPVILTQMRTASKQL